VKRKIFFFGIVLILTITGGSAEMSENKALVIGLDGADWDVIKPLIREGEMPNLEKLMEDGGYGNLTSTRPIESPVAWSSMTTGTTPGKHGIYGFIDREGEQFLPTTAEDVKQPRVWDKVGERGKVVVMNVPQTFPPSEVNGSLVSSYLSIKERGYTYPESLQKELEDINYKIEALEGGYQPDRRDEFLEGLNTTVEKRTEAFTQQLNKTDNWKLGFVVYTGLDRLQHYFWEEMKQNDEKYGGEIESHYMKLDEEIGKLLKHKDETTTVFVVSDHGFGSLDSYFYLNTWLSQEGYLELEGENDSDSQGALAEAGLTQQNVVDILDSLGILDITKNFFEKLGFNPGKELPSPELSDIDLEASKAYAGNYGGKIHITDSVEDKEEVMNELKRKLEDVENPETEEKVFSEVYRSEEIYTGDMKKAPDLILQPKGPYRAVGFLGHSNVLGEPTHKSGSHRREGIYVIDGNDIEKEKRDADITDLAPTVLDLIGMKVHKNMDGDSII
jgi:predicted AlkP superfamily phosphohydrolase/phosphomutase